MSSLSKIKDGLSFSLDTVIHSYAMVFFSTNRFFGLLLILASFVDPVAGFCGIIGLFTANIFAYFIGLNTDFIRKGYHGYDAMLVSVGIAHFYSFNLTLFLVIVCVGIFSILIAVFVQGILHKYHLPSLSFPFLITLWLALSALPTMNNIFINNELLYELNEIQKSGDFSNLKWLHWIEQTQNSFLPLPKIVVVYFKSLSSLFFQTNVLSGILIAIGLLCYSRIAFSLSVLGYLSAYFFYPLLGGDVSDFYEKFIGLNFVFQAIAIGGIFLIPSFGSYLITVLLTPPLILVLSGLNKILYFIGLAPYSLPFATITLLFLFVLNQRSKINGIHKVQHQLYHPEKNLYAFLNSNNRLRQFNYFPIYLPIWGEWMVSQGHDGKITHLGDWSKAFDFIVLDDELKSYQLPGSATEDFYCYNKPVLACADGHVVALQDNIDDNNPNEVNTLQNWGNTVVICHAEGLYSQVSHLKKGSLKHAVGDFVKRGEIIALCGSSGRSPEPHLHFQLQSLPTIGAKTLDFPLAYYLLRNNNLIELKTFDKPKEGQFVRSIDVNNLMKSAYDFMPGKKYKWSYQKGDQTIDEHWEIFTDSLNHSYIYSSESKEIAYFYTDGTMVLFTSYIGNKKGLLYHFYLANYKVALGFYKGLTIEETYPMATISLKILSVFQDFVAPFYRFVNTSFCLNYEEIDDVNLTNNIKLNSSAEIKLAGIRLKVFNYQIYLKDSKISRFEVLTKRGKIEAICEYH
jgi:urea transporter/murein DD-endopeptidase MepM/ murein hydrolase activator NlpD